MHDMRRTCRGYYLRRESIHHYNVEIETEFGEKELLRITAVSGSDAEDHAEVLVKKGILGLKGKKCISIELYDAPEG